MKTEIKIKRKLAKISKQHKLLSVEYMKEKKLKHIERAREIKKEMISLGEQYKILNWILEN